METKTTNFLNMNIDLAMQFIKALSQRRIFVIEKNSTETEKELSVIESVPDYFKQFQHYEFNWFINNVNGRENEKYVKIPKSSNVFAMLYDTCKVLEGYGITMPKDWQRFCNNVVVL